MASSKCVGVRVRLGEIIRLERAQATLKDSTRGNFLHVTKFSPLVNHMFLAKQPWVWCNTCLL